MAAPAEQLVMTLLQEAVDRLNRDDWPGAQARLRRVLQLDASHGVALYLLGVGEFRQSRWALAEALFRKALAAGAAPPQVSLHLAWTVQAQGRAPEAVAILQAAVRVAAADTDLQFALAQAHEATGAVPAALEVYRTVLRLQPAHAKARLSCAALLTRLSRLPEAEQLLREAPADRYATADQVAWLHQLGLTLKGRRRHTDALACFERALIAAPQERDVLASLSVVLQHLHRYEEAASALERIIERDPLDLDAHAQLNELFYRQQQDDRFLRSYDRAASRTPQPARLWVAKGRALLKAQRPADALEAYERALSHEPSDPAALAGRARALETLGRWDDARAAYESSLARHAHHAELHIDAAAFFLRKQEDVRAKGLLLTALAARPTDQAALALLGLCHRGLGEEREEAWLCGYEHLVRFYDLPPPDGYGSMADFNRDLANYLEPLHADKREHFTQTLRGGTRLYDEVFNNGHELVERLRQRIDAAVAHYLASLAADERHPFIARRAGGFYYVSSWSSRLTDQGFHLNHVHPQGWISSAYYIAVPEAAQDDTHKQGWLKFGEPTADFGTRFAPRRWVRPVPGRLVLFPSYLWHGTVPFHSNQMRMTIAFDVAPLGVRLAAASSARPNDSRQAAPRQPGRRDGASSG